MVLDSIYYQIILPLESERELNMIFFKNKFKGSKNQNWNVYKHNQYK